MAELKISLPDNLTRWIDTEIVGQGRYADIGEYLRDLVRQDRELRTEMLTPDELRALIDDAERAGMSGKSLQDLFEEARIATASRPSLHD